MDIARNIRADYKAGGVSYVGLATKYSTTKEIVAHIIKNRYYRESDKLQRSTNKTV